MTSRNKIVFISIFSIFVIAIFVGYHQTENSNELLPIAERGKKNEPGPDQRPSE